MARVNPEMIALARESRGYTQQELANLLGVTQGRISKVEKGLISVSDELLDGLCEALNYPRQFFGQSPGVHAAGLTLHRKRKSLPKCTLEKIQAQLIIRKLHISKLLDDIEFPADKIPSFKVTQGNTPANIARKTRVALGVPAGPVENFARKLEKAGILIVPLDLEHRFIDAVSCKVDGLPTTVFINSSMPGDRQRFTLAHELGHLVMHDVPVENMEDEADRFASEFLMPEAEIQDELYSLSMRKLWELKSRWKVSMAALVMRAKMLGCITENQVRYLWIQLSKAGYRLEEPAELAIPQEKPTFMAKILELNLEDHSEAELSELLCLEESEFRRMYMGGEERRKKKILNL